MSKTERRWVLLIGLWLFGCDDGAGATAADDAEPIGALDAAPDAGSAPSDGGFDGAPSADATAPDVAVADVAPTDALADAAPADAGPTAAPLAPTNAWGPAARIDDLEVPATPLDARRAGCLLYGDAAGTGARNLLLVAGGNLSAQVRATSGGRVRLVLLFRARGWPEGAASADLDTLGLDFFGGTQDEDLTFRYAAEGFVDGRPEAGAAVRFDDAQVLDGWLEVAPGPLVLPLSLPNSPVLPLGLEAARVTGRVAADGPGFRIDQGAIAGYLTRATTHQLVDEIKAQCAGAEPPGICRLIGGQLDQPTDMLVDTVIGLAGGFDAQVDPVGGPGPCAPGGACDALAVCLRFTAEGVVVAGISQ
ncbi:MAG: hypothetical protein H6704_29240 [Myxococcales bacterium]|nr:hypothetical protein [Myxococcales bacterium]